jgi:tRNA (guanine37-N1)-methyltransferase
MLYVDVITLFPEMFAPVIGLSIVGRAIERGLADVRVHDIIASLAPGERADERPFGGGPGMVLRIEPLARILDGILAAAPAGERRRIVLTAADGRAFAHADAAAESRDADSFVAGDDAIDHPSYTQPRVFRGVAVPEVLLSGDHAKIAAWRRERSRERAALRKR